MKKFVVALGALTALAAAPAMARSDTHVSFGFGFYSPAPVYYEPAPVAYYEPPVVYYPPVNHVYFAPEPYYGWHGRHEAWEHHNHFRGGYGVAWNDRDDNRGGHGGYGRGNDDHDRGHDRGRR